MKHEYLVISLITADPKDYLGCKVIRDDEIFPMIYRVVHGPAPFMDCFEWIGFNCRAIHPWWEDEKKEALKQENTITSDRSLRSSIVPHETRKVEIGHIDGVPEVKVEWEGGWIKHPVLYHRDSKVIAYAEFSAPGINEIWGDITTCAAGAAAAAGIAAILASPAAALPAFKAAFLACLVPKIGERANQISVALSTKQEHGEWHRV